MTKIILYHTLQELYQNLGLPISQDADFTIHKIEDVHQNTIKSPVFRANYYSFLFIESGRGKYSLDDHEFKTKPFTVYFTNPGHIKSFETIEPYTGYMVSFSEVFLKKYVHSRVFDDFPFLLAETVPPGYLTQEVFGEFKTIINQIYDEYHSDSVYKLKIIGNLFVVILLKIKEQFWNSYDPQAEADRGSGIVNKFKQNMEQIYRHIDQRAHLPNVQEYANMQRLHPNYFNTVIKNKTGKSVNTWISEKTIAEAKALLANSDMSVKEIAYKLKFSEPGHFNKYFKKHIGITPALYRHSK
jgi:AraC-like DNA-binding protein